MPESGAFVLEVSRIANSLTMSLFERSQIASTLKSCSSQRINVSQVNHASQEIISLLNQANRANPAEPGFLPQLKKNGQFLWDHLLAPQIKNKLRQLPIKDLVLSLDEELIDIPWELLFDGESFLSLKFSFGRAVRTKEQMPQMQYRGTSGTLKMLILANPTNDLHSAYLEGTHIKNQFDRRRGQVKIDFKSTRIDTLYVKKNLRDYDIIHFAGHCEYDRVNPRNTGWLLDDGKFTTADILGLSDNLTLPSLVFSNACQSAKSSAGLMDKDYQEKNYSLAAAFLFSGVRHYIGTVWQIADPMSRVFAEEFYSQLIRGKSIGECMRLGRMKLISQSQPDDLSWASYILYGDPNHILFRFNRPAALSPQARLKKKILGLKKHRRKIFFIAAAGLIALGILFLLPLKNPSAYLLFSKAQNLLRKGSNLAAIDFASRAIAKDSGFLAAYPVLASAYERAGEKDSALKAYFDYAYYSQEKNDYRALANAYLNIGWLYHSLGDYPKALEFYEKALSLSVQKKDKLNQSAALRKMAVWHIDKEENDKAMELLFKSLEIDRARQNIYAHRYNMACDYFDIALVYTNKNDYEAAREFYRKSKAIFDKLNVKNELSDYYFNVGELCLLEKQYSLALENYLHGLKIDEAQQNLPSLAADYNMLGELYLEMGKREEAGTYFYKALEVAKKINAVPDLAAAYYNLGQLHKQKRQFAQAREYFRFSQEIYRKIDTPTYKRIREELSN